MNIGKILASICVTGTLLELAARKTVHQNTFTLDSITEIEGLTKEELSERLANLDIFRRAHNVKTVISPQEHCCYEHFTDEIRVGTLLTEKPCALEFGINHELGHRKLSRRVNPYLRIAFFGAATTAALWILRTPWSKLSYRTAAPLWAVGVVVHCYLSYDEYQADLYACMKTSRKGLEIAQAHFTDVYLPFYLQLPWWKRWSDPHMHPTKRIALIESFKSFDFQQKR